MARARWKPNFFTKLTFKKSLPISFSFDTPASGRQKILLDFKGQIVPLKLKSGYQPFQIISSHLGLRFGSFMFTRTRSR